jgi:hypothetical protein
MSFLNYYELSQPMNNAELLYKLVSNAVPKHRHTLLKLACNQVNTWQYCKNTAMMLSQSLVINVPRDKGPIGHVFTRYSLY